jgi:plastocyanin
MTAAHRLVSPWHRPANARIFDTGGDPATATSLPYARKQRRGGLLARTGTAAGRRVLDRAGRRRNAWTARRVALAVIVLLATAFAAAAPAAAQGVMDRPPNMGGTWAGSSGTVYFNFLHRFTATDGPTRKVLNFPTFLLAAGLPANLLAGFRYATNSDLVPAYPNEWEFFGRWNPIAQARGGPFDIAIQGGYNLAAESIDGELSIARAFGPLRVMAAGRGFTDTSGGAGQVAIAGGATLALSRTFAIAGDIASFVGYSTADGDEPDAAWGVGLQIAIPYTPHTFSIQATNTNTGTLQGSSVGSDTRRYGFEFTIPITLSRYFGGGSSPAAAAPTVTATGDTVRVVMRNLTFSTPALAVSAGTTVVWVNEDAVQHTVTADDGSFDSGLIDPRASWSRTFTTAGTIAYHCTPHPFMKGTVTVR